MIIEGPQGAWPAWRCSPTRDYMHAFGRRRHRVGKSCDLHLLDLLICAQRVTVMVASRESPDDFERSRWRRCYHCQVAQRCKRYVGVFGVAALVLAGCGDDGGTGATSDADPTAPTIDAGSADASGQARFAASWTLQGGCLGGDEVELEVANSSDGRTTTNRFPCTTTSGTSDHVGVGTFDIQLRVIDTDLEILPDAGVFDGGPIEPEPGPLVALSDRMLGVMSAANTDTALSFAFPTASATISTSWKFMSDDQLETCAEVGAVNVELEYERVGASVERTVTLPCTDLGETTPALPTGLYLLRAKAVDGAAASVRPDLEVQVVLFVGNQRQSASLDFVPAP